MIRHGIILVTAALLLAAPPALADDDYELLPDSPGRDEVYGVCGGCHSVKLVLQQGLPRDRWDGLIDYMVEEHGMAELDDETRDIVLDYLGEHFNTDHRPTYIKR